MMKCFRKGFVFVGLALVLATGSDAFARRRPRSNQNPARVVYPPSQQFQFASQGVQSAVQPAIVHPPQSVPIPSATTVTTAPETGKSVPTVTPLPTGTVISSPPLPNPIVQSGNSTVRARMKVVVRSRAQELCEIRARHMARTGTRGHVLQHLGYGEGRMEGCGWSTSPQNVPTCVGRGAVLGDYTAQGVGGYYRVRIYQF